MEPTADIDLSPQRTTRERTERILALGIAWFVLAVLVAYLGVYLFVR
jgi:hypothetical protein